MLCDAHNLGLVIRHSCDEVLAYSSVCENGVTFFDQNSFDNSRIHNGQYWLPAIVKTEIKRNIIKYD